MDPGARARAGSRRQRGGGSALAEYLKRGRWFPGETAREISERVARILAGVEERGEEAVREYSQKFDGWNPASFRLTERQIEDACATVDEDLRSYLDLAVSQVRGFAEAQLATLLPLDVEIGEGVSLGHRHVPVGAVGAYVPGGQYKLISSALMSVLTAKVAGVGRVVATSAPSGQWGVHAPTIYAMRLGGADEIYAIGGVQAMAAMAFGAVQGLEPVDMLVGAGNAYVAEAKRQLFGRVGIDLIAGPTEILIIADGSARARVVAVDLLGQAEHGPTSPSALVTTSRALATSVLAEVDDLLKYWPTADVTRKAWEDCGTVIVAEDVEEAISISDGFAPEHLELQVEDSAPYEEGLKNYGSLFIGEETTVPFGDKAVGTNHTLPTAGAARYTGGLWVGKFLKTLTYQRLTPAASRHIAVASAGISHAEGMFGHEISARIRLGLEDHPRAGSGENRVPRVAVVGAGPGGLSAARRLKDAAGDRVEVVIFERERAVEYLPGAIPILLGKTPRERWRVTPSVEGLRTGEVKEVAGDRVVVAGETFRADAVIAAPGLVLDTHRVPDAPNVYAFWDPAGAEAAVEAATGFGGGTVAVVISSLPYRCPPAPFGMAMELAAHYREREARVLLTTPEEVPLSAVGGGVSDFLERSCAAAGVDLVKGFEPDLNSLASGELRSKGGDTVPYDLAFVVPPHGRPPLLAGLPGDGALVPVSEDFESEEPNLFVVGDAAMVPLPRAADAAAFEGRAAADAVLRRLGFPVISENPPPHPECYVGHGDGYYTRISLGYPEGLPPAGAARAEIDGPSESWAAGFEGSFGHWRALRGG